MEQVVPQAIIPFDKYNQLIESDPEVLKSLKVAICALINTGGSVEKANSFMELGTNYRIVVGPERAYQGGSNIELIPMTAIKVEAYKK